MFDIKCGLFSLFLISSPAWRLDHVNLRLVMVCSFKAKLRLSIASEPSQSYQNPALSRRLFGEPRERRYQNASV